MLSSELSFKKLDFTKVQNFGELVHGESLMHRTSFTVKWEVGQGRPGLRTPMHSVSHSGPRKSLSRKN